MFKKIFLLSVLIVHDSIIAGPLERLITLGSKVTLARLTLGTVDNGFGFTANSIVDTLLPEAVVAGGTVATFAAPLICGAANVEQITKRQQIEKEFISKLDEDCQENPKLKWKQEYYKLHYLNQYSDNCLLSKDSSKNLQISMILASIPTEIIASAYGNTEIFCATWLAHLACAVGGYRLAKIQCEKLDETIKAIHKISKERGEYKGF